MDTFSKREKEKKRLKKRQEKQKKKEERQANSQGGGLDDMIAYVDEFGNIVDTPPDPDEKEEVSLEDIEISVPKKEDLEDDGALKGKVVFFNHEKGFGFIRENKTEEKYFVHINGVADDSINENDTVTFELEEGRKGLNAVKVTKI